MTSFGILFLMRQRAMALEVPIFHYQEAFFLESVHYVILHSKS